MHARLLDFDGADAGVNRALAVPTVSHNESTAVIVDIILVLVDVRSDFGFDRRRQHLLRTGAKNFSEHVLR